MAICSEPLPIHSEQLPLEVTQLKFKDFLIYDELIGDKAGHFGEVYRGKLDELLPCAAKRFFCFNADKNVRVKIEQELQLLSVIKHPCLVQNYSTKWCNATSRPILLMELLEESLLAFINRQEEIIPYHIKVSLCHDIALGVSYLHTNGIIHGNLTRSNVLILGETRAKVTDYWMMRIKDHLDVKVTKIPEKIPYMAPERINGPEDVISVKSDSFSVGVLLLEIDSQSFVKPGTDSMKDSPFTELAMRCLATDPSKRPALDKISQNIEDFKKHQFYSISLQQVAHTNETLQNQFEHALSELSAEVLDLQHKLSVMEMKSKEVNDHILENIEKLSEMASLKVDQSKDLDITEQFSMGIIPDSQIEVSSTVLGEGNSSIIYKGRWKSHDIAFKRLKHHQKPTDKWIMSLYHETSVLSQLSHRNVLRVIGMTRSPGNIGIAIEEHANQTLYALLFGPSKRKVLPETKKKRIIRHTALGIEYLHSKSIRHGGLSNISILESNGVFKVANYGPKFASKDFISYHSTNSSSKMYTFSSPEVLRGDILSSSGFQKADVYSLALVAYEVLSEKHCFEEGVPVQQHANAVLQYDARPDLGEVDTAMSIKDLLATSWDSNPERRITAKQFVATWI